MDKKEKKRLAILREQVQRILKQISAEKKQTDDPVALVNLQNELARLNREIETLQATK